MLDKLQHTLYRRQIDKVEAFFRKEIKNLMRKTRFIDDIHIDDDFNTHIYKNEDIEIGQLCESLSTNTEAQISAMFGVAALQVLKKVAGTESWEGVRSFFASYNGQAVYH